MTVTTPIDELLGTTTDRPTETPTAHVARGTVIGAGEVETTAFAMLAAVHAARPDGDCVVHPAPTRDEKAHRAVAQFEEAGDDAPLTWGAVRRRLGRELPGYDA